MKIPTIFLLSALLSFADTWTDRFDLERIAPPVGVDPQIGGLATLPDQRLIACFHRGEVMIYDPAKKSWSLFAEGLHEPLGILVEDEKNILVMQRPELTRLTDTDGDGVADVYRTVYDGFGMTGNYHEFAFGPARDKEGNLFIALNVASNGAGVREEIRGEWNPIGLSRENMLEGPNFGKHRGAAGRMYSRVPYRGWVLKLSPDGSQMTPFASGFRSPDGIGFDARGQLLITDNQGDWLGTSKLHEVREGNFYGHVASLIWRDAWKEDPLKMKVADIEKIRTSAAALLPQGELANSPTQPVVFPEKGFGPFAGETMFGDMNQSTLIRYLPDESIKGGGQGTAVTFFDSKSLGIGNHRFTFTNDGSLWIGKTHLSWAGGNGLLRLKLKNPDEPIFCLQKMEATPTGFTLSFSEDIDPATFKNLKLSSWGYHYFATYGSPKTNAKNLTPVAKVGPDGKTIQLEVPALEKGKVYALALPELKSKTGQPLLGTRAYYHMVKLP